MLLRLYIHNFVIVDRLELEFSPGFGVLTGETGAGKSILIDALSLALGERALGDVVQNGAARADIAAEFDIAAKSTAGAWLMDNGFDTGHVLLRRVVETGGRSRAWINGAPVTVGQLREVGSLLTDIHGQHAHLSLLSVEAQRTLLDTDAGLIPLAKETAAKFQDWRHWHGARLSASRDAQAAADECDVLEFQLQELTTLDFVPSRWLEDNAEHKRLSHATNLIEGVSAALAALEDSELAATGLVAQAQARVSDLLTYDVALTESVELLDSARIQLAEAIHALNRYSERLEADPERLQVLDTRIAAVILAARKHRVTPEELPQVQARLSARLEDARLAANSAALEQREAEAFAAWQAVAQQLSAGRRQAAEKFSRQVSAAMQDLGMQGGEFGIAFKVLKEPSAHGQEDIEFVVSANAGQPLRPLAKVASGGELSRIGLSIQVIASRSGDAGTLIFDEVDAGIGGGVAEIVGRLLRQLGQTRQVLCVTHLPQVAACANWQWSITKQQQGGLTLSQVHMLDDTARIDEIARMLGGVTLTETTRQHAAEMLANAREQ